MHNLGAVPEVGSHSSRGPSANWRVIRNVLNEKEKMLAVRNLLNTYGGLL
jgi:hypothetical protein